MDLVCHHSFGFGLKQRDDIHTLIPRGTRLPVHRQVTLPVDKFYRPADGHGRIVQVPLCQGQGARAISLATLEIVAPLKHPKSCRVIFRLTMDGWLRVSATIGRRRVGCLLCVNVGPPRRQRKLSWSLVPIAGRDAPIA